MSKYKKEKHIELSDGDTYIVANSNCPLLEHEAKDLEIIIEVEDKEIPCCACTAFMNNKYDFQCPYYFGYINTEDNPDYFDCRIKNKR